MLKLGAADYLSSRLSHSQISSIELQNSNSKVNRSSDSPKLVIKKSDTDFLILRDAVDKYTKVSTIVELSKDALSKIGDYLVEIQTKITQLSNTTDSSSIKKINSEINKIENEMSVFIGKNIDSSVSRKINISEISDETKNKFFTTVKNENFTEVDAKKLASIEVNFSHAIYAQTSGHNESSCSICQNKIEYPNQSSNLNEFPQFGPSNSRNLLSTKPIAHFGSTTNSTSGTGASPNSTTSISTLDPLLFPNRWKVSAGQTMSYSYYQTAGVSYNYSINGSTATSDLGTGPGTAGNSLIGNGASSDVEASLDLAFDVWDKVGAWTFEKINESSANGTTTVGEIRSRAMTDIGTTEYGAFAYGPANSAIGGDIWYTTGSSKDFNPGNSKFYTALHEIGHAVGLSHPFDGKYSRGSATLTDRLDSTRYTVMSYTTNFRNKYFSDVGTSSFTYTGIHPDGPGPLDINAIEHMYGTSTDTNLGDTTYSFVDKPVMITTIVDSGGTDTIDLSNQSERCFINLKGMTASTVGFWGAGNQLDYYSSLLG